MALSLDSQAGSFYRRRNVFVLISVSSLIWGLILFGYIIRRRVISWMRLRSKDSRFSSTYPGPSIEPSSIPVLTGRRGGRQSATAYAVAGTIRRSSPSA